MATVYVSALAVVLIGGWYLIPYGIRMIASARLRRHCRRQKIIVLSYDDGPSARLLPHLLDLLAAHQIRATFFLLGRNVEAHGEALPRLFADEHEIGSHTYEHINAWKGWPGRVARDLARGIEALRRHGVPAETFRPPYGKATLATLADCWMRGVRLGWWTIDSRDVWDRRPIADVIRDIEKDGGGVVLMHDLDTAETPDSVPHSDYVLDLTRTIIDFAARNGFQFRLLRDVGADAKP